MSWDISIMHFSREYDDVAAIPDSEKACPLGSLEQVHEAVNRQFPAVDWSDPVWGMFDCPFGSIEFNIGEDEPVTSLMLHVRAGEEVVSAIVALCRENRWQGIDCGDGSFIEKSADPTTGLDAWRGYRDQVLGQIAD